MGVMPIAILAILQNHKQNTNEHLSEMFFYMEGREGWERDRINKVGQDVTETWVSLPVPVASPKCLSVCLPLYLGQPVRAFLCSGIMAMGDVHQARVFVFSFRYTHLSYHIKHVHV